MKLWNVNKINDVTTGNINTIKPVNHTSNSKPNSRNDYFNIALVLQKFGDDIPDDFLFKLFGTENVSDKEWNDFICYIIQNFQFNFEFIAKLNAKKKELDEKKKKSDKKESKEDKNRKQIKIWNYNI